MKNNMLPPPISGAVQQSLTHRSQVYEGLGRLLLSFTVLVVLSITPFGNMKGQSLWPSYVISQTASDLCVGYVDFEISSPSPLPGGYTYDWKVDNVSTGVTASEYRFSPNQVNSVVSYDITCDISDGVTTNTYGPYSISSMAGLYVKTDPTYIKSCDGSPTLDATISGASIYSGGIVWYQYDPVTTGHTYLSGGSQYLTLSSLTSGTYYYYYTSAIGGGCTAQSGMYEVYVITTVDIVANNVTLGPGTTLSLDPSNITSPPVYTNLQWYLNSVAIPGATSTSYTVSLPGVYSVSELSPSACGVRNSSNTVTITCNATGINTFTNPTFTYNQTFTGINIVYGTMTIDPGVTIGFSSGTLLMDACSQIIVNNGTSGAGGTLTLTNMVVAGCGTWGGISVYGASSYPNSSNYHGKIVMDNSKIQDAMVGIILYDGGIADVSNNSVFENNNTHIGILGYSSDMQSSTFTNVHFNYTSAASNCYSLPNYALMNDHNLVYAEYCYGATFSTCTFDNQNNINSNTTHAIEGSHLNAPNSSYHAVEIQSCTFVGDFARMINIQFGDYLLVHNSSFDYTGSTYCTYGIFLDIGVGLDVQNNSFAQYVSGTPAFGTAIFTLGVDNVLVKLNLFSHCTNGMEFYLPSSSLYSYFTRNIVSSCDNGIIVAPASNPINATSANSNTNLQRMLIRCNDFSCTNGIVGCGNIIDQEYSTGNHDDWSNTFSTTNYDVAWENTGAGGFNMPHIYYYSQQPNASAGGASIFLNNTTINSGSIGSNISITNPNNASVNCSSLRPNFSNNFNKKSEQVKDYLIIPNPANDHIIITAKNIEPVIVRIYDFTGKLIKQISYNDLTQGNILVLDNLASGIYSVVINNIDGKVLHQEKLTIFE